MKHIVIPIFVPHKGCPFDCIYCNQKLISGQMEEMTAEKMRNIVEAHLKTIDCSMYIEIGFFGGSFTGIDKDLQIEFLKMANEYIKNGLVKEIRLSTRPDYIDDEILGYLKFYNVRTIELGAQSMDEEVLAKSCRGHSADDVINASAKIKGNGIRLGIQTMIGLPGDTREKALATAHKVIRLKPDIVRIYPTLVIKHTFLENMFSKGEYIPLGLDESVDICSELLELYEDNNIKVIRIGLQPTENINEKMDVVSGPFHPAFRQLVESRTALRDIEEKIYTENLINESNIIIYTSHQNISNVIGQKKENVNYLRNKYNFNNIIVKVSDEIGGKIYLKALKNN